LSKGGSSLRDQRVQGGKVISQVGQSLSLGDGDHGVPPAGVRHPGWKAKRRDLLRTSPARPGQPSGPRSSRPRPALGAGQRDGQAGRVLLRANGDEAGLHAQVNRAGPRRFASATAVAIVACPQYGSSALGLRYRTLKSLPSGGTRRPSRRTQPLRLPRASAPGRPRWRPGRPRPGCLRRGAG
jgi:hypothetical protein